MFAFGNNTASKSNPQVLASNTLLQERRHVSVGQWFTRYLQNCLPASSRNTSLSLANWWLRQKHSETLLHGVPREENTQDKREVAAPRAPLSGKDPPSELPGTQHGAGWSAPRLGGRPPQHPAPASTSISSSLLGKLLVVFESQFLICKSTRPHSANRLVVESSALNRAGI